MAGRVIRVVPKTFVTFTPNTPNNAINAPQTQTMFLARQIDISRFREVTLFVRLHTPSIIGNFAGGTFPTIVAYADGYTEEDPNPSIGAGTAGIPTGFFTPLTFPTNSTTFATNTATTVQTLVLGLQANAGGLIAIGVSCKQVAAGTLQADLYLSIDLAGKE